MQKSVGEVFSCVKRTFTPANEKLLEYISHVGETNDSLGALKSLSIAY